MKTFKSLIIGLISAAVLATTLPARAQELPNPPGLTPFATDTDVTIGFEKDGEVYYLSERLNESGEFSENSNLDIEILPSAQFADRSKWVLKSYYDQAFAAGRPFVAIQNQASGHFLIIQEDDNGFLVGKTTFFTGNLPALRWFLVPRIDGRMNLYQEANQSFLARLNDDLQRTEALSGSNFTSSPIPDQADWRLNLQPPSADSDGDGVADDQDAFPNSILSPTVVIDGRDTGVPNTRFSDGSTISDQIAKRAASAENHGQFVSAVVELTNWLKSQGIITGAQKGAIDSAAAKSNKG